MAIIKTKHEIGKSPYIVSSLVRLADDIVRIGRGPTDTKRTIATQRSRHFPGADMVDCCTAIFSKHFGFKFTAEWEKIENRSTLDAVISTQKLGGFLF